MSAIYRTPAGRRAVEQRYRDELARWERPAQHRSVDTRQGPTFVVACGPDDAPPAVLLHGGGTNNVIWFGEAAQWSRGRRLYLVDVVGEPGLSAPSRPPLTGGAYADWLDDVLDGLGVDRAAFVGASLGGWLALDYAIRRPNRVERLALRAPGGVGSQKFGLVLTALLLAPFGERGLRAVLRSVLGDIPDREPIVDYMTLIQKNYRPRRDRLPIFTDAQLQTITAPLYVSLGGRDRMLDSRDTARRLRRLLPDATVVVAPAAGHALTHDTDEIADFLQSYC